MNQSSQIRRSEEVMALLVKASDNELSVDERIRFEKLAADDPSILLELEEMNNTLRSIDEFGLRDPNPDDWRRFEESLGPAVERSLGWILLLVGYIILVSVGLFFFFKDPQIHIAVKLGGGALGLGFAVLLFQVGRRFAHEYKKDPYKNVIR